jgi:SPP1 family predicted phage head-tail adaptor
MTELQAGALRQRVTVEKRTSAKGTRGQSAEVWEAVESRFAEVATLSGRELEQARKNDALVTHRVTIRRPRAYAIDSEYRFVFEGKILGIGSAIPTGNYRDDLDCLCVELKK